MRRLLRDSLRKWIKKYRKIAKLYLLFFFFFSTISKEKVKKIGAKMNILIYFIIAVLFAVLIFWTWNNTKDFEETSKRVIFIVIGIMVVSVITLIYFTISKVGITYPKTEMVNQVRKMVVLLFTPINGYLSLPHIASLKMQIKLKTEENSNLKKKIIILGIVLVVATIIEISYMKDFQRGIIQMLNSK